MKAAAEASEEIKPLKKELALLEHDCQGVQKSLSEAQKDAIQYRAEAIQAQAKYPSQAQFQGMAVFAELLLSVCKIANCLFQ